MFVARLADWRVYLGRKGCHGLFWPLDQREGARAEIGEVARGDGHECPHPGDRQG